MSKPYIIDRALHWISALLLLYMLLNMSAVLHTVDWTIKGQIEHRQDAVASHAFAGVLLLIVLLARIAFARFNKADIPRVAPKSPRHKLFIDVTHVLLYVCIFVMMATGLAMVNSYEIPLHIMGIEIAANKPDFFELFPTLHDVHMLTRTAIWWLIAIHFVGIMRAK